MCLVHQSMFHASLCPPVASDTRPHPPAAAMPPFPGPPSSATCPQGVGQCFILSFFPSLFSQRPIEVLQLCLYNVISRILVREWSLATAKGQAYFIECLRQIYNIAVALACLCPFVRLSCPHDEINLGKCLDASGCNTASVLTVMTIL